MARSANVLRAVFYFYASRVEVLVANATPAWMDDGDADAHGCYRDNPDAYGFEIWLNAKQGWQHIGLTFDHECSHVERDIMSYRYDQDGENGEALADLAVMSGMQRDMVRREVEEWCRGREGRK